MIVSSASEPQISVRAPRPAFVTPPRRAASAGIFAADLANDELLPPRDRQGLVDAAQQDFPVSVAFGAHVSLKSTDCLARNKAVAVHTNKALTELLFQLGERFLEEVLALGGANGDVLQLRLEIDDVLNRDQDDSRTF